MAKAPHDAPLTSGMTHTLFVPGRANLIGEHIDYHGLPVLPIALRRGIRLTFTARADHLIHATSATYGHRSFEWTPDLAPTTPGDWENYLRAAAQTVAGKWGIGIGIDAHVESDLPPAAGLSSSSALLIAFTLALLRSNHIDATFEELMEVLPDGEQFVGTRGGGMDHAAILSARAGHASLIHFDPISVRHVPIPPEWVFLIADSGQRAEKSGDLLQRYNALRIAGTDALRDLGFASYSQAIESGHVPHLKQHVFEHVVTEAQRVLDAVDCLERNLPQHFGQLLLASHASLRDRLHVSCPPLDRLVDSAMHAGALGARLTGAGFGGCAIVLCLRASLESVSSALAERGFPAIDAVHS